MIEYQERCLTDFNRKFDAINADRAKAQSVIEDQERRLADFNRRFEAINADRAEAQRVMEHQFAQIQKMHAKMTEQKQVLATAKAACRNKGRCFVIRKEPKPQGRSKNVSQRNSREFRAT